jgi:hypothetical protein
MAIEAVDQPEIRVTMKNMNGFYLRRAISLGPGIKNIILSRLFGCLPMITQGLGIKFVFSTQESA